MELRATAVHALAIPMHWPARKVALIVGVLLLAGVAGVSLGIAAHAHHTYHAAIQTATVGLQAAKVSAPADQPQNLIALVTCATGVVTTLIALATFAVSFRRVPAKG